MLSVHESTWSKELKQHTCCGSTHSYHKGGCAINGSRIPGRSSDPLFISVQSLKVSNPELSSADIARIMNLPLDQVNELWLS